MSRLWHFLLRLFGFTSTHVVVPDPVKSPSTPRPDIKVVEPVINSTPAIYPWYMTSGMIKLLKFIYQFEGGAAGYNADFGGDDRWSLTSKSLDQVIALAKSQVRQGEPSSAIGAPQFLSKTLESLKTSLNLTGKELFTPDFQDDLAVALMIRRGLLSFLRKEISIEVFANNLAMEWASLPCVTTFTNEGKTRRKGFSYYAGDGLNRSHHSPEEFLAVLRDLSSTTTLPASF